MPKGEKLYSTGIITRNGVCPFCNKHYKGDDIKKVTKLIRLHLKVNHKDEMKNVTIDDKVDESQGINMMYGADYKHSERKKNIDNLLQAYNTAILKQIRSGRSES